jgi:hypothetical protein
MRSTYDVPLPDDTNDEQYLALLRSWLPRLMQQHRPQLIFFQAGVDALKGDRWAARTCAGNCRNQAGWLLHACVGLHVHHVALADLRSRAAAYASRCRPRLQARVMLLLACTKTVHAAATCEHTEHRAGGGA